MRRFPIFACVLLVVCALKADELSIARSALRDGLWEIARTHAMSVSSNALARLVVLESYASEGKWKDVVKALAMWPDSAGPSFDYYRAVARGDLVAAAKILKASGSADGLIEAALLEADRRVKVGDRIGAESLWRGVASATNVPPTALAVAASNLMDAKLLRRACEVAPTAVHKRALAIRLGRALLADRSSAAEGMSLIRSVAKDAPDTDGARDAFLAVADAELVASRWAEAAKLYSEAIEIWPDAAKLASVQEGLGWALAKQGRDDDALSALSMAMSLTTDKSALASVAAKRGDILSGLGRIDEAMVCYREARDLDPKAPAAKRAATALTVCELESEGRVHYRAYRFAEARAVFARVAKAEPSRTPRMRFFEILCLYGAGEDDKAAQLAESLLGDCKNDRVRADALLWLAKFRYSRREWKRAQRLFLDSADAPNTPPEAAAEALLWAARAASADRDTAQTILLTTRIVSEHPESPRRLPALLLQGETLNEMARFDEAILVFERVSAASDITAEDRIRAQMLRADALFAMGADNPARYAASLEAYRSLLFTGKPSPSQKLVASFKIARALEKLKRIDEALDQYYSQVVVGYRNARIAHQRLDDEACAVFPKAAFRLAEEYESRGRERQAVAVLELVATSDSPAAVEARSRITRLMQKGRFL